MERALLHSGIREGGFRLSNQFLKPSGSCTASPISVGDGLDFAGRPPASTCEGLGIGYLWRAVRTAGAGRNRKEQKRERSN
jgi:hypothetical protein